MVTNIYTNKTCEENQAQIRDARNISQLSILFVWCCLRATYAAEVTKYITYINLVMSITLIPNSTSFCKHRGRYDLPAVQPQGFCNHWYSHKGQVNLSQSRGLFITKNGNVLLLDRRKGGNSQIVSLIDKDFDGVADEEHVLAKFNGLNHGIAVYDDKLYASTPVSLYRWSYKDGQITMLTDMELVISDMLGDRGHNTRTFVFDEKNGYLYMQVGSAGNVDTSSGDIARRSLMRRFKTSSFDKLPINFDDGELIAYGIRNEVGLTFDKFGNLWGVENSADNLFRADLGGDIHNDNPSEEVNYFPIELDSNGKVIPQNFGYPYCFTEFNLPNNYGLGRNTLWAWPDFIADGIHSDDWCRQNTRPPKVAIQAHLAPLGIAFLDSKKELHKDCPSIGSFPDAFDGNAFIAVHGSWDREPPVGYKLIRIPIPPVNNYTSDADPMQIFAGDFLFNGESNCAQWSSGWRPVDVKFDLCNRLLVSSDSDPGILMITYNGNRDDSPTALLNDMITSPDNIHCHSKYRLNRIYIIIGAVAGALVVLSCIVFIYVRVRGLKRSRGSKSLSQRETGYQLVNQSINNDTSVESEDIL